MESSKTSDSRLPASLSTLYKYFTSLDERIYSTGLKEKHILVLILLIAAIFAYYPHMGYDFPVHRDEWIHLAHAKEILESNSIVHENPYYGGTIKTDLEIGFRLWLAELLSVSGMSEWVLMDYLPIFISCFLVLSAFLFGRRLGYGLEAAFFTALIPTSINLLGPAFVVAVALGSSFLLLSAYVTFKQDKKKEDFIVFFPFLLYLFLVHPPTAIAAYILLIFYVLVYRDAKVLGALAAPFVLFILFVPRFSSVVFSLSLERIQELITFSTFVQFGSPAEEYGFIVVIFAILGIVRAQRKEAPVVIALILLLFLNNLYSIFGEIPLLMPERNYTYIILLTSVLAGYGLYQVRSKALIIALIIVVLNVGSSFQLQMNEDYYHIIDEEQFNDFIYIKNNVAGDKVLLHPWEAFAFPAAAEKNVYTSFISQGSDRNEKALSFLQFGCSDTEFLVKNNIDIVYSSKCNPNEDLKKVKENIYVVNKSASK